VDQARSPGRPRVLKVALLATCLLVLVPAARADEAKLPWNPFASAKEGDWQVVSIKADARVDVFLYRVTKVTDDKVVVATGEHGELVRPRKGDVSLTDFLSKDLAKPEDFQVADEKKTVAGREFACQRLSWSSSETKKTPKGNELTTVARWRVWISKESKCDGIVSATTELSVTAKGGQELTSTTEIEVLGFGNGDKVEWGKKLEEVVVPATRLPFPVLADAKAGDWEALRMTRDDGSKVERGVFTCRVEGLERDDGYVVVDVRLGDANLRIGDFDFSRKRAPSVESLVNNFAPARRGGGKVTRSRIALEDAKKTVGGKELACTRASFADDFEDAHGKRHVSYAFFFSKDVRGPGIVAAEIDEGTSKTALELAGFGRRDTVEWGSKPEDVKVDDKK
jgi:hypothetical protein